MRSPSAHTDLLPVRQLDAPVGWWDRDKRLFLKILICAIRRGSVPLAFFRFPSATATQRPDHLRLSGSDMRATGPLDVRAALEFSSRANREEELPGSRGKRWIPYLF